MDGIKLVMDKRSLDDGPISFALCTNFSRSGICRSSKDVVEAAFRDFDPHRFYDESCHLGYLIGAFFEMSGQKAHQAVSEEHEKQLRLFGRFTETPAP